MRFHQSWYRARVLKVPYGTGPFEKSATFYGNMLTKEAAKHGLNFLTPEICHIAEDRIRENDGLVEPYRLRHNMLSSQPMCFNLFGLLSTHHDLATRLFQSMIPNEIVEVMAVRIEYAPAPRQEYLNDNTAFDAFVEYRRSDGSLGFLGIETKLAEPFSPRTYRYDDPRRRYKEWTERQGAPWQPGVGTMFEVVKHNQLWRDHLLVEALRYHPEARYKYSGGRLVLVRHPDDDVATLTVRDYCQLLVPDDTTFVDMPLDRLVNAWSSVVAGTPEQAWLAAFHARYLDLQQSEAEWNAFLSLEASLTRSTKKDHTL